MSDYASTTDLATVARRIAASQRPALCTHRRPDGDALGSALAVSRGLARFGTTADIILMGPIEPPLMELIGPTPWRRVEDGAPGDDHDLIVVLDTGAWPQLEPIGDWLRAHRERVIVIDHHPVGDDVGDARIVESRAAATVQIVLALLDEMGFDLAAGTEQRGNGRAAAHSVAEALFVGLATDTGWFRFSNADAAAFAVAARLLAVGVDKSALYRLLEETHRPQRLALEARSLASIQYLRDDAVAVQVLGPSDFAESGASIDDLTSMVNAPMVVGAIRVAILLAEVEPGLTKMSFRAKPSPEDDDLSRVNDLAARFGGGGHAFAAGATFKGTVDAAMDALREALVR
ncbi:MAG: hypothetical protein GY715_17470 [Planctomycetes bacterium]|nr:hypothetical protein [Planctomycetota bacterium]